MARETFEHRAREVTINLLRIAAGLLFMQHGAQKLFGWLQPPERAGQTVELMSQMGLAGVLEFFGGALIVLGLFTRPVAFVLAGEMAFAFFTAHAPRGPWPILSGGELAALYAFLFLYLAAHGGGTFSLDGLLRGGRPDRGAHRAPAGT